MTNKTNPFGFNCPAGGDWYACGAGTSKFVGCCTSDPCSDTKGCAQGNIRSGAFDPAKYGKFADASCGTGSSFTTCGDVPGKPTFWGCCKSPTCVSSPPACPAGDLTAAYLDLSPGQMNAYLPSASSSSSPTPSPTPKSSSGKGAIIGGAVGAGVVAIIIGVLIFFFCRRRKRNQRSTSQEAGSSASTPMMKERQEDRASAQYGGQSPPPTYSSPNPNVYQPLAPTKGNPYQAYNGYSHQEMAPQELPANTSSSTKDRYSELPAGLSSSRSQRISELPAGANRVTAELESSHTSPQPLQAEFSTDMAKQVNQGKETSSKPVLQEKK